MRPVIALLLGLAMVVGGCDKRADTPGQAVPADDGTVPDVAPANTVTPEATGKVDRSHRGEAAPAYRFLDPAGKPVTLAGFVGKPLLLNVWATWCAPCVREMPTLDALALREGDALTVLAVSQDLEPAKVQPFLTERGLKKIAAYRDPDLQFTTGMGLNLPTTILYDAAGKEMWRVTGAMDWAGADAAKLIAEAKG